MIQHPRGRTALVSELAAVPMLAPLPAGELGELALRHPVVELPPGRVLLRQGDPARSLLIVLAGRVTAVADNADGHRRRYPGIEGPCAFDKAALLAGSPHLATWTTTSAARVLRLGAAQFTALLRTPAVREHVLRHIANQVIDGRSSHRHLGQPAVRRVADWLTSASARSGTTLVRLPAGQQGLAEELLLSRITVNRALQYLARAGAVVIGTRCVTIIDRATLAGAAS